MHTSVEFGIIDPIFTTPMRDFAPINFVHLELVYTENTLSLVLSLKCFLRININAGVYSGKYPGNFYQNYFWTPPPPPSFNFVHGSHMSHGWSHHLSP